MKKLKLLLATLALLGGVSSVWATDYTSSLPAIGTNWDITSSGPWRGENITIAAPKGQCADMSTYKFAEVYYDETTGTVFEIYKTLSVPNGTYIFQMAVFGRRANIWSNDNPDTAEGINAEVFAGDATVAVTSNTFVYYTVTTTVTNGSLKVGLRAKDGNKPNWWGYTDYTLVKVDGETNVDLTKLLVNPSFEANDWDGTRTYASNGLQNTGNHSYATGWNYYIDAGSSWCNVGGASNPSNGSYAAEIWAGSPTKFKVYQTIDNLPAGRYSITTDARTNNGNFASSKYISSYAKANGRTAYSPTLAKSVVTDNLNVEDFHTLTANFIVTETGAVELGLESSAFIQFDNFRLTYLGDISTPVDMTNYIVNPDFINNKEVGWTSEGSDGNYNHNGAVERYHGTGFKQYQTITNLPNGKYEISVQMVNGEGSKTAKLYTETSISGIYDGEITVSQDCAGSSFDTERDAMAADADYGKITVNAAVTDGTLKLGIAEPTDGSTWIVFDNFKLTYLGSDALLSDLTSKNNYDEYAAEVATAGLLGTDISGISAPTTSAEALAAAHAINVLNYNKVVDEGYEDVSATTLGTWTDNNVISRSGQHWDGNGSNTYFEMNAGYGSTSWSMSRSQSVSLAAGKYILKVAARVSPYANATLSVTVGSNKISTISGHQGDNGKGITTDGVASYDEGTFANTTGRGFEWKYIPFELTETGTATLSFTAEGHAVNQYVSFTSLALLTDPKVAARTALLNKINEANTVYNSGANVGSGVFQVPTAAGSTFNAAISTAQGVYNDDNATSSEIESATSTLNTAITTYQNQPLNAPDESKAYVLQNTTASCNLTVSDEAVTISASGKVYFTAVDGGYVISNSEGKYIFKTTGNNWTLSTTETKEDAYVVTVQYESDGAYSIHGAKGYFGTDNTAAGSAVYANKATSNNGLWKIYPTVSMTVSDAGMATYVNSDYALDFSESDIKAYKVKVTDKAVATLTQVDKVPAGTPVLLYYEGGKTEDIPVIASADAVSDNDLVAGTGATVATIDGDYTNMILNNGDDGIGFYFANNQNVATGRAYLHILTTLAPNEVAGARGMRLVFDGDITGISEAAASAEAAQKDGKFFENNKLVIFKNGKKFNANGAQMK